MPRCRPATPLETTCCRCPEDCSLLFPENWKAKENNGLGQQARPGMVIRASESVRRSLLSCLFSGEADPAAVHTPHRTLTGPFNDCLLLFGGWQAYCYFKLEFLGWASFQGHELHLLPLSLTFKSFSLLNIFPTFQISFKVYK